MHALEKKTNLKTLSAPKITTLNNQTATIEIADEFVYPTRYEPTLIKEDLNGNGVFTDVVNGVSETRFVNVQTKDREPYRFPSIDLLEKVPDDNDQIDERHVEESKRKKPT